MSSEWPLRALEDIAKEVTVGFVGSMASEYVENGVPFLRSLNIDPFGINTKDLKFVSPEFHRKIKKSALRPGDVVIVRTGKPGTCAVVPDWLDDANCSDLVIARCGAEIRPKFLCYWINSAASHHISSHLVGAVQQHFNVGAAKKMLVATPSLWEQDQVISVLGSIDDRITLLRETNATLEAIAKALFKSWFVDFDPVRAKAEGLEPEGMDAATAVLFSDSFEESELGLVPKGWKLVPFGELLINTIGGDWGDETPSEKNDTRVAIIRGTDIPDLQSGAANRVPLRYTSTKKLATRKLQDGDLVLEVSGGSKDQPTGRALYLTEALLGQFDCPVEPASFCRLLRPIDRNIGLLLAQHLTYIYGIGKTWEYQNQSTGIANFQTTHFLESELVAVPPREVLAVFADVVRSIVDRGHLSQIQNLASLRDTLLPRLISGQLRLPEAEVMVEEVCA